jgi:hypothetical protein
LNIRPAPRRAVGILLASIVAALFAYFGEVREAGAVPSFARKYQTSCLTCHTVYPVLNPFGEAFRRNGYRFPSQNGSVDSDAVKEPMIALGQEEYKETFPESVWPAQITEAVPLSVMFNGAVSVNFPKSDAHDAAGHTFDWGGLVGEVHLFGAGSFSDTVTYFTQLTIASDAPVDIETAYLLWNDVVGPSHAVNLWVGRLFAPQLTSFGLHSSYLNDSRTPAISVIGLYNATGSFTLGQGHTDGAELNGILFHRLGWSAGWVASSTAAGLSAPNAEDAYVHLGVKSGGVALDGEGKYGPNVPDPAKPWAEKAITLDAFAYHGMNVLDNGTGTVAGITPATPVAQRDRADAVGASMRAQLDSLVLDSGLTFERHQRPYAGTPATAVPNGTPIPGVPDYTDAKAVVQWNELDYVVFPWLVPGVRTELTRATYESSNPVSLFRLIPGVAMLVRPDVRVIFTGDFERAYGMPVTGAWGPAGGAIVAPGPGRASKFEAEQVTATVSAAF